MRHHREKREREPEESDLIYGRWPVREALQSGGVAKVFIAQGSSGGPIDEIVGFARERKVPFLWVERRKLDLMVRGSHQGVVAHVAPVRLADMGQLWATAADHRGPGPCLVFLDGVQDPQNLGSILRSAAFFGVPGVVVPKWRAAGLTAAVLRASAGGARLVPVAQVSNLASALVEAKERGIWIVGADMSGDDARTADLPRPFALVLGSEGEGLHELVRKRCDVLVALRRRRQGPGVESLNVGVAAGILFHQFA